MRRTLNTDLRNATLPVLCITAAIVAFAGCQQRPANGPASAQAASAPAAVAKVPVHVVQKQTLRKTIRLPATLIGYERAPLVAMIDAYVKEVHVNIGDEVKLGDPLVDLDAPELTHEVQRQAKMLEQSEAAVELARAEMKAAEAKLDEQQAMLNLRRSEQQRITRITLTGALSASKRDEAMFAFKSAQAAKVRYENAVAVAEAEVNMALARAGVVESDYQKAKALEAFRTIRAPFSGVVTIRNIDIGAFVRPTSGNSARPLIVVEQIDKLRAVVHATVDGASLLDTCDHVELSVDGLSGEKITGKVSRTAGVFDEKSRMMRVEIDIPNEPDASTGLRKLRAGTYGEVEIVAAHEDLPTVPASAIFHEGSQAFVMVVDSDGKCQRVPIAASLNVDGFVGVTEGISTGDRVVAENPDQVKENQQLATSEIEEI